MLQRSKQQPVVVACHKHHKIWSRPCGFTKTSFRALPKSHSRTPTKPLTLIPGLCIIVGDRGRLWVTFRIKTMSRFRGRFDYSIDEKGRVNIPAKFRKMLAPEAEETFVICRAPDGCLWAYPQDAWEKFEDSLDAMPVTREANKFQRQIQNSLTDSQLDKQGRIALTPLQMEIAGITKDVTIIGRRHYLEIWDTKRFEGYTGPGDDFDSAYYAAVQSGIKLG